MAGRVSQTITSMMTVPAVLRRSGGGDALTCAAAAAIFDADAGGIIDRRYAVSDPGANPPSRKGGIMFAADGLLRVIAVPAGGTLPTVAVYARFADADGSLTTPIRLAIAEPPAGGTKDTCGATVLELAAPPGDCQLTALTDQATTIYYSHTV